MLNNCYYPPKYQPVYLYQITMRIQNILLNRLIYIQDSDWGSGVNDDSLYLKMYQHVKLVDFTHTNDCHVILTGYNMGLFSVSEL